MPATATAPAPSIRSTADWLPALWIGLFLMAAYAPTMLNIAGSWFDEALDMQHGIVAPFVAGYMAWLKREAVLETPVKPSRWGLPLIIFGMLQSVVSLAATWTFLSRTALLISLLGCLLYMRGSASVRILSYPLFLLLFMIAPPTFIYEQVTLSLQLLASRFAEGTLDLLGYSVLREGNILELVGQRLSVEEACSGLRSLITLCFLVLVYNPLFVQRLSIRIALLALTIPIAMFGNAMRIVLTAVVGTYNQELAHGVLHEASSYVILVFAATMVLLFHKGLEWAHSAFFGNATLQQ